MTPDEEAQIVFPMLMMLISVQRYNDLLEGTVFYKRQLKQGSKHLAKELERVIKEDLGPLLTDEIPGLKSEDIVKAMNAQDSVIHSLVKLRAYEYPDFKKLMDAYIANRRGIEGLKVIDYWQQRAEAAEALIAQIDESVPYVKTAAGTIAEKREIWQDAVEVGKESSTA